MKVIKETIKGSVVMYLSTLFFAVMGIFVKIIKTNVPSSISVFYRSFFGVIFIILLLLIKRKKITIVNKTGLLLRGIFGALALYFYFKAISELPRLADAAMLCYTFPIYATVFSIIFLKEPWNYKILTAVFTAICGIALILKPGINKIMWGHIYGIIAGLFAGAAITMIKHVRKTDSSEIIVGVFMLGGTLITFYAPFTMKVNYKAIIILLLIGISLTATIAQLLSTYAYKHLSTKTGSVISLFVVFNIVILSWIFFSEIPDLLSLLGGILILISSVFLILHTPKVNIVSNKV